MRAIGDLLTFGGYPEVENEIRPAARWQLARRARWLADRVRASSIQLVSEFWIMGGCAATVLLLWQPTQQGPRASSSLHDSRSSRL